MTIDDRDQTGLKLIPDVDRRAFLASLGGGVLVLCPGTPRADGAQGSQGPPPADLILRREHAGAVGPKAIAAWVHVGLDAMVTVYTGKVEIGQNVRTSLAQVVAEELRVPFEHVRMIMGDTDLVPFDNGTFASQTTPIMGLQLRRAAVAARETLAAMAAEMWDVDPSSLTFQGGRVRHEASDRSISYRELTQGHEFVGEVPEGPELTPGASWVVAGHDVPKARAVDFVTGRHRYASDMKRPGLGHGKVLRPSRYGLTLKAADTARAEALPGVRVVREGPFVGVVADDEQTAAQALSAISRQWVDAGTKPPGTHETVHDHLRAQARRPANDAARPEVAAVREVLARADVTIRADYTAPYIAHVPLEPRAAVVEWDVNGRVTIWTGTQRPFAIRTDVARAFNMPEERVHVMVPDTGSGYGGKHSSEMEVECARLARAAGRPVRLAWTREEEFAWGYFRPAGVVEAAAGASRDGALSAWEFRNINSGTAGLDTPYRVAAKHVEFLPAPSPLRQGAYRALASTLNHFARESLMDEMAHALGLDPLAFRLRHIDEDRLKAALTTAADRFGWEKARTDKRPGHGVGLACGAEKGSRIATMAEVAIEPETHRVRVVRVTQVFEPGAVVNPRQMANQVEGAVMMGLGGALFEAIQFGDGKLTNGRLARYRVPRFSDAPALDVCVLNRPDVLPAGGGEIPIVGIAPAVANAIFDATGRRLRSLPLTVNGQLPAADASDPTAPAR
jgi:isoquinoline 1-oxidoreductase